MCGLRDTLIYLLVEMCTLQVTLSGFCSRQGRKVVDTEITTPNRELAGGTLYQIGMSRG
jgi:hypothetical protein